MLNRFFSPPLAFLFLVFFSAAFAQNTALIKSGNKAYDAKNYGDAVKNYEQAMKGVTDLKPKYAYVYLYMGNAYKELKQYEDAVESYSKAAGFGESGLQPDEITEATTNQSWCEREIINIPVREKLTKNPINVTITNLGKNINSAEDDYCPSLNADNTLLIITSRREGTTGEKKDLDGKYFEDFYISTYSKTSNNWSKVRNLGPPVNTEGHESIPCLSADGQTVYYYKWTEDGGNGDIYTSAVKGKKWKTPEKLSSEINTDAWESQPSVTADGNTLYFVSNREGGEGGRDIYVSFKDKITGRWGSAKNLGPVINTKYDEGCPFIHPDGKTLYFSSQGHGGMGGYDVFITSLQDDGTWSEPKNMGYPINSEDDDVFFRFTASGDKAYFSSVRKEGLGGQDIYLMDFPKTTEPGIQVDRPKGVTTLIGIITDEVTHAVLEANVVLENIDKGEVIATFMSNEETGKYLVILPSGGNYGISVSKEGYLFHSENFNIPPESEFKEVEKDVELKKIETGQKIILKNIFFDYDKATLRPESRLELDRLVKLMQENPNLKIEISGHTDNMGTEEYNINLSYARARAVVDYLITNGIDRERLVSKGYGESQPIETNDTEEGRQLNRRTEFKILSK